jgi:hypothetical protein
LPQTSQLAMSVPSVGVAVVRGLPGGGDE